MEKTNRIRKPASVILMQTLVPWLLWFGLFSALTSLARVEAVTAFILSIATVYIVGLLVYKKSPAKSG